MGLWQNIYLEYGNKMTYSPQLLSLFKLIELFAKQYITSDKAIITYVYINTLHTFIL